MAFSSSRIFRSSADYIPVVAEDVVKTLQNEGYAVSVDELMGGDVDISISKGDFFKSILGMKTALKITMTGTADSFCVDCKVGIFGMQVVPTAISMILFWPVMITQIWGLVRQNKLDDHIYGLVEIALDNHTVNTEQVEQEGIKVAFCSACGSRIKGVFCSACGKKL
jgi:hypothetical protein